MIEEGEGSQSAWEMQEDEVDSSSLAWEEGCAACAEPATLGCISNSNCWGQQRHAKDSEENHC